MAHHTISTSAQPLRGIDYHNLMSRRIRSILLICSSYDAYTLEEDGRLEVQINREYMELNLSNPPSFTRVSSATEAVEVLKQRNDFDLVISMFNVGDLDVFHFSKQLKALHADLPFVLLINYSKDIYRRIEHEDRSAIDYIFCWHGNADLILAIVKLIEDRMNADNDILGVGVQSILLVEDSIRYYLDRTVECGFNHIVVDVRPISGTVLYESDMLEPLTVVGPDTVRRDWDYLQCFLDEARKRELKVTVSTMIFPAGFTTFRQGAAYSDPELAGRTCVEYTPEGRKDIKDDPTKVAAFLNPVLPENQEYVLRFAHELLTKYKFDGYALDYCRFPDAESDFSPASREAFETYLGHGIDRFPEDIFTYDANGARVAGPYYKQWWEFRSGVIRDFIAEVRTLIERTQPGVKLEYWAASWLHAIYTQGQNWASPRSRFHEAYLDDWATPTYNRTGFADLLDVFITGTYLEKVWGMDDPESIEYGLARSLKDVDGDCAVYGSLYAQNHVDQFEDAVYLCLSRTDGVMVFDIIQVIENDLWDDIKRGIDRAEKEQKTQK